MMEATGVYYERLAHHLHRMKKLLHVALPTNTKHYLKSLNVKSKTDSIDSKFLAQFACERKHLPWQPPKEIYARLRALTRYLEQLKREKVAVGNRIHSKEFSYDVPKEILKQEQRLLREIEKGVKVCLTEIEKLVASDQELSEKVEKLSSIKGVGFLTVAETLGMQDLTLRPGNREAVSRGKPKYQKKVTVTSEKPCTSRRWLQPDMIRS